MTIGADHCNVGQITNVNRQFTIGRAVIAELTGAVQAPTLDRAGRTESASVQNPTNDRNSVSQTSHGDRKRSVGQCAVAELAETVCSPTLGGAIGANLAAVNVASRYGISVGISGRAASKLGVGNGRSLKK